MERLVALSIVIVHIYIIDVCHAYPGKVGTEVVADGQVRIGAITGGRFGPGSFTVGQPGSPRPRPEYNDENDSAEDENGGHVVLQNSANNGPQHNKCLYTQMNLAKPQGPQSNHAEPQRVQMKPGQGGKGGQGGSGGQIVIEGSNSIFVYRLTG